MTSGEQEFIDRTTISALIEEFTVNPAEVRPGRYELDSEHGKVSWHISHLGFSTYVGHFTEVSALLDLDPAAPEQSHLVATIATASVSTCHAQLDEHLRSSDFLDVERFPEARFVSRSIRLLDRHTAEIDGEFTLHGVTNPLILAVTFNQAGINPVDGRYTVGFDGSALFNRCDFDIAHMFPPLGDKVRLRLEGEFKAV